MEDVSHSAVQELVTHVQPDTFAAFIAAQQRAAEADMAEEMGRRLEAFKAQLAQGAEDSVTKARTFIIDHVLTLHCPRCKAAFLDFDGCLAITCRQHRCHCGFCGVCLEDCGDDAHEHVTQCKYTQGDMFASEADVPVMQNAWRRDKIAEHLSGLGEARVAEVLASLERDFKGVGLSPAAVRQAVDTARAVRSALSFSCAHMRHIVTNKEVSRLHAPWLCKQQGRALLALTVAIRLSRQAHVSHELAWCRPAHLACKQFKAVRMHLQHSVVLQKGHLVYWRVHTPRVSAQTSLLQYGMEGVYDVCRRRKTRQLVQSAGGSKIRQSACGPQGSLQ